MLQWSSRAITSAILFSNPSSRSFENGRLLGSAAICSTRRVGCVCATGAAFDSAERAPGGAAHPPISEQQTATNTSDSSRKREHMERASLAGVLRQVFHRVG